MADLVEVVNSSVVVEVLEATSTVVEVVVPGPEGPAGPVADASLIAQYVDVALQDYFVLHPQTFSYSQAIPAAIWTIVHPLDHRPTAVVTDTAGEEHDMEQTWPAANVTILESNFPFAGTATLY